MRARKKNVDNVSIMNSTHFAKQRVDSTIKLSEKLKTDPDKNTRKEKQQCQTCYYISGRIGGSAMTTVECGVCDDIMMFSNTCVDTVCPKCAKKHNLCVHCGGDIDMVQRRKQRF